MSWFNLDRFGIWLLRQIFKLIVRASVLPKHFQEINVDPEKPIYYVLQQSSAADLTVLDMECIKQHLPRPMEPPRHGTLDLPRSYFMLQPSGSVRDAKTLNKQSPRLHKLVEAVEQEGDLDVQLVPVSIFWGRSPDKEDSIWKILFSDTWAVPNTLNKMIMVLLQGRQTHIQFSEPLSLRQIVDEGVDRERTVRKASRILRVHFRRQREAAIGPDLSHRRTMINTLLRQPSVRKAMKNEIEAKKQKPKKVEKTARGYVTEIAADYSHRVIQIYKVVLTWLWNRLYDGVEVHNAERLRQIARDNEVIYVPCHRSHIDYLLLSYVIYEEGMVPPHIAAGSNLDLPVLGPILRRGGAFFLRRSFSSNRLYSAIFYEYLHTMLSKGFAIEYFIEGGRSRTGRSLQPRTGMISMTVRSYLRNSRRPIAFVPVYFGYEKVFEGGTYVGELSGKKKKKESLFDLMKSLRKIQRNFGKVHVNFGSPLYLDQLLNQKHPGWREHSYDADYKSPWFTDTVNTLAHNVIEEINKASVINPVNLLSLVLLATNKHAMDERTLRQQLDFYIRLMKRVPYSDRTAITELTPPDIIAYGERMELLNRQKHPLGDVLFVEDYNGVLMTFFRNNILHMFTLPSLVACFIINDETITVERIIRFCRLIYPFLQAELFLHWEGKEVDKTIRQIVELMLDAGLIEKKDGSPRVECPNRSSQEFVQLSVLASSVRQTLERYYMTAALLLKHGSGSLSQNELENLCHLMAQRLSILHEFNAPEFFDKSLFKTFLKTLKETGYIWTDEDNNLVFDDRIEIFSREAHHLLSEDIRLSIIQVTELEEPKADAVVKIA